MLLCFPQLSVLLFDYVLLPVIQIMANFVFSELYEHCALCVL